VQTKPYIYVTEVNNNLTNYNTNLVVTGEAS